MRRYTKREINERTSFENQKEHLLKMLIEFDKFCNENGLRYYLSGGTLLGAVRHKGFIPWDDDIDVNMPREDCEKLMELTNGYIKDYQICPPNSSVEYSAYHWKLYDDTILVKKAGKKKIYPIFIDIFPIEGLPDTEFKNKIFYAKLFVWKKLFASLRKDRNTKGLKKIAKLFVKAFAGLFGREFLFKKVVKNMSSIPFDKSDYVGVAATNIHTTEERVIKRDYCETIKVDFEGYKFNGPKDYDTYLRQLYGDDYMELPPVEKRVSRHGLIPYEREKNPHARIAILGLIKSQNVGEQFIARSLEYLIKDSAEKHGYKNEIDFIEIDILGRNESILKVNGRIKDRLVNYKFYSVKGLIGDAIVFKLKNIARKVKNIQLRNLIFKIRHFFYRHTLNNAKRLRKYYKSKLVDIDYIVVDGAGLLEYSYNEYHEPLLILSEVAEELGLDIVYNAIGTAGEFNEKDFRASIAKRAIDADVVKYVSARDSQEIVQKCSRHNVKLLADAAFWMEETYQINKSDSSVVGIGLIRGNSLTGYNVNFKAKDWVELFSAIARELESRGYEYEFFTNGLPGDVELGKRVLKNLGLDYSKMVKRPVLDTELYTTISRYKGLITCRMHSSIAAFTLRIPSVILSWNAKVEKLMNITGYPERAIRVENFNAPFIVDSFERALKESVSADCLSEMKKKSRESVDDYIDSIVEKLNDRDNYKGLTVV